MQKNTRLSHVRIVSTGLLSAMILTSCANGPAYTKGVQTCSDCAQVYAYRSDSAGGTTTLSIDNEGVASLYNSEYVYFEVKEGTHVMSVWEGGLTSFTGLIAGPQTLSMDFAKNHDYFLRFQYLGMNSKNEIKPTDSERAQFDLAKKLLQKPSKSIY